MNNWIHGSSGFRLPNEGKLHLQVDLPDLDQAAIPGQTQSIFFSTYLQKTGNATSSLE